MKMLEILSANTLFYFQNLRYLDALDEVLCIYFATHFVFLLHVVSSFV